VLSAPNWLDPYPVKLSGAPKVIEVNGKWSINYAGREIDAYSLKTPHATNYIVPYVPDAKLGLVTDIWSPGRPLPMTADAAMISVGRARQDRHQAGTLAGGHGFVDNYSVWFQLVQRRKPAARAEPRRYVSAPHTVRDKGSRFAHHLVVRLEILEMPESNADAQAVAMAICMRWPPGSGRSAPRSVLPAPKAIFGDAFRDKLREISSHRMPFCAAPPLALP